MTEYIYSKWERTKCEHGRFYYVRWRWKEGQTIEDSEPEVSRNSCKLCYPKEII